MGGVEVSYDKNVLCYVEVKIWYSVLRFQ